MRVNEELSAHLINFKINKMGEGIFKAKYKATKRQLDTLTLVIAEMPLEVRVQIAEKFNSKIKK